MVYELISALIVAVVQGLTEWIPVSSSGHLVLAERLLNYGGSLEFNVSLHFGTLMAAFVYFGKDIVDIVEDLLKLKWGSKNAKLGFYLIVATIPAAIVGFLLKDIFASTFSNLGLVALGFGITGLFLLISSFDFGVRRSLGYGSAFGIGLAQILALFSGISRSGSTMAAGVLSGLGEREAVKFSFLMSIPIIFGANILSIGNGTIPSEMIWATLVSFAVGLATIHVLFSYVLTNRKNFRWFGGYCLLLALIIGAFVLF